MLRIPLALFQARGKHPARSIAGFLINELFTVTQYSCAEVFLYRAHFGIVFRVQILKSYISLMTSFIPISPDRE